MVLLEGSLADQIHYFFNGDIAEVIVYDSEEDPTDNETGLALKYGL